MYKEIKVVSIDRIKAGISPVFRVKFSDGFFMRSDNYSEHIPSFYYQLMNEAVDTYEYGTPFGATSHEDLYNY